jgi:hypothetical protein
LLFAAVCAALVIHSSRAIADDVFLGESGLYADSGFGQMQGPFTGTVDVDSFIGAPRFYAAGYTGSRAVMANIEAGYVWTGHETLGHVGLIPTNGALGESDRHATWVGMIMGGRPGGANPGPYQEGIAPDAQFFSGAIAPSWSGTRYSATFSISNLGAIFGPYRAAVQNGITGPGGTRTADVVNTSWVTNNATGSDTYAGTTDALAFTNPRTLLVAAAGNNRVQVPSPASAFNDMTVAALDSLGGAFDTVADFSAAGPNDYFDPTNGVVFAARQMIDISAPGEEISTAYYGGETGGNRPSLGGAPAGLPGGPDYYSRAVAGTSVAAPIVTGAAALLYDAAYDVFPGMSDARDARVIKAVLKNAADKTVGWNNGQVAHPNGNGGVLTTKALDERAGTGRLNLDQAFDQFFAGTSDVAGTASGLVGTIEDIGWDFGQIVNGVTNDYVFDELLRGGSTFTATLDWFRHREQVGTTSFSDVSFQNLDLELWKAIGGVATALIAESKSVYNNSEHFSFTLPTTGEYLLRVRLTDELFDLTGDVNTALYGLAWSGVAIPEPATLVLLLATVPMLLFARSRQRQP